MDKSRWFSTSQRMRANRRATVRRFRNRSGDCFDEARRTFVLVLFGVVLTYLEKNFSVDFSSTDVTDVTALVRPSVSQKLQYACGFLAEPPSDNM